MHEVKPSAISAKSLRVSYGDHTVLRDVSAEISQGEFTGVIGPNGGGKTTFLKVVLGILRPDAGSITVMGESPFTARRNGKIGYVPQKSTQAVRGFPSSVGELVASGLASQERRKDEKKLVLEALSEVDLADISGARVDELSGGQLQRALIARALVARPAMLILDEPTTGIDIPSRDKFAELLDALNKRRGLTILLVSHDVESVAGQASRVLCLNQTVCCHAPAKEFHAKHAVADFFDRHSPHTHV